MADQGGDSEGSSTEKHEIGQDSGPVNKFQNDGSFMEMFKKRMEEEQKKKSKDECTSSKSKTLPVVGKRRMGGSLTLKTGAVKKKKAEEEESEGASDAWSKYMAEVKKYKSQSCQDEDKTRPLVK